MTRRFRTYAEVGADGGGDIVAQVEAQAARLQRRLAGVRSLVAVASGKGGVGKSLITANVAAALAQRGRRVGVLDADLNGPCAALMLGAPRAPLRVDADGVHPATGAAGCRVMSMDLLLDSPAAAVRWHGPAGAEFVWQSALETGALREFLADTVWGDLDFLFLDLPPGTDRITRMLALVPRPAVLLLVTTPSRAASDVVARSITHARDAGLRDVALVSNMDGYACTHCGVTGPLFHAGAAANLAARFATPLWAAIPFDPALGDATDAGRPLVLSAPDRGAARALAHLADTLERHVATAP